MQRLYRMITVAGLALLAACGKQPPSEAQFQATLPASWERQAPGANSMIHWHLDLLPGGQYQLRTVYTDKAPPNQFDSVGSWSYDATQGVVVLQQDSEPPLQFAVRDGGQSLLKLDDQGKQADPKLNAPLQRLPAAALIQPEVAQPVPLRGTYWKLVELGGSPVPAAQDRLREPSLLLAEGEDRASGSGGCNRFSGGFKLEGERLSFLPMAATRMACLQGGQIESGYLLALSGVASYRLRGGSLELLDAAGGLVVRFEQAEAPQQP